MHAFKRQTKKPEIIIVGQAVNWPFNNQFRLAKEKLPPPAASAGVESIVGILPFLTS